MNLSEPFIRRPVMTILVMVSIALFGLLSYQHLPVSDLPNTDFPTIKVSVSYPGASPETMSNSVATPLEQQFMTIEGIQSIFSNSNTGSTTIVLQFHLDRDIDSASTDVQAALSRAQPNLPSDLPNNPVYEKVNPAATPILFLVFTSELMTMSELYTYADTFVGERLSMVEGVSEVSVYGSPYAVRVQVDPEKLAAKQIGIDQVTNVIQKANVDLPLGTLYGKRDDYTVAADGQIFQAKGYAELILKNEQGQLVKIKDIGMALDSIQNDKSFQHYVTKDKDQQCVLLAIQRQPGENTVRVVEGVNQKLQSLQSQIPASLKIERIYDQAESIRESIREVNLTLGITFVLVITIIYLSLGRFLNTIIPSLALPVALLGTFSVMGVAGFSADILSMLALILSIGFLVDDAIVVLENSVRHMQAGKKPFEAAIEGAKEISVTVCSITLCLIAAFLPMLFMGGVVGRLFREFAVTIVTAVFLSGFVSLTLTPMLTSRMKPYDPNKKTGMERLSERLNERLKKIYEPCLHWALKHPLWMVGAGSVCVAASISLFLTLPKDFLPPEDIGFIECFTMARDGTSPFLMEEYHEKACRTIQNDPNVEALFSINSYNNVNEGIIFVRLKPYHDRLPMNQAIAEIGQKLQSFPGINFFLSPIPLINLQVGTTAQALYQYSLNSLDRNVLYHYAPQLLQEMKKSPLLTQVSSDLRISQPQWQLQIDRDRAYSFGVDANAIEQFFTYAYSDNKVSQINADINQYDVLVETLPQFYRDPSVLSKLYVRSNTNALVPLAELVNPSEKVGPLTVNHVNGLPAVNFSFNIADGVPLDSALKDIETMAQKSLPPGVSARVIGTADIFQSSFAGLTVLLLIAFFVIYVILGILYESFIHPLTVMSTLPPALFGGLFTLFTFRQTLSVYSFVGLILLVGIVLKNGILIVEFANESVRTEKKSPHDAIVEASLIRFRPILMTTVSALMGAVPIAFGLGGALSQTRIPLGLCIVGGLLVSQALTLLLTPVLYVGLEKLQQKLRSE